LNKLIHKNANVLDVPTHPKFVYWLGLITFQVYLWLTSDPQLGPSPPAVPQSLRKTYRHAACCCHGNQAATVYHRSGITQFRSESCPRRTGRFILLLSAM